MTVQTSEQLAEKKCAPCEGEGERYSPEQAREQLQSLEGWQLDAEARKIHKEWKMKDFMAGIRFFERVADVAEQEGHHPDLHLEGYRNARIEVSTHAIGGLSENDFILAAKIDRLPVELRS